MGAIHRPFIVFSIFFGTLFFGFDKNIHAQNISNLRSAQNVIERARTDLNAGLELDEKKIAELNKVIKGLSGDLAMYSSRKAGDGYSNAEKEAIRSTIQMLNNIVVGEKTPIAVRAEAAYVYEDVRQFGEV